MAKLKTLLVAGLSIGFVADVWPLSILRYSIALVILLTLAFIMTMENRNGK